MSCHVKVNLFQVGHNHVFARFSFHLNSITSQPDIYFSFNLMMLNLY